LIVVSRLPEIKYLLSAENAREVMALLCPFNTKSFFYNSKFFKYISLLTIPNPKYFPSGEIAIAED
jgi:hypothetical protein